MKKISFFTLIIILICFGGYILYDKKSNTVKVKTNPVKVEDVSRETPWQEEVISKIEENIEIPAVTDSYLIQQIQTLIKDIRTISMGNYENLKKEYFNYNFGSFDWDIGSVNGDQFFIELKNIDKTKCNKLIDAFMDAITVKVNSTVKKDCDNLNNIRFIFN